MGNTKSNNKIPSALCEPTYQIYSDTGAWEVSMLKKLVLDGRLAPFYPPVSEVPPQTTTNTTTTSNDNSSYSPSSTTTVTTATSTSSHGRKRSTNTHRSSLFSRFHTILHVNNNDNQQTNNSRPGADDNNTNETTTATQPPPRPLEDYYDECPICMMYYQGGMNVAKCCSQRICSECVIQICKQGPKYAETSSVCPFCKCCPFKIDYKGPKQWSHRCRELEEEQAVIQLKIKHQQEEDKQQEEERRKRLESSSSSSSLNNSQQDVSILSNSTRNVNTNTSFTSTNTTATLSNNNSFSSPTTISTPSTATNQQANPVSGISFLETYFANRRLNDQHQQQQTNEESATTPTSSSTYSTQNHQDNDDSYFRYIFGSGGGNSATSERAIPSPTTRTLHNALISRLQNRFFIDDEEGDDDDEDEDERHHDYLGYYLAGNRSPIRRPAAGPIYNNPNNVNLNNNNNNNNNGSTRVNPIITTTSSASRTNPSTTTTTTATGTTNSSNPIRQDTEQIEGLPTFSDFIPTSIDVTNVSADDEMLNEAIRLSLLEGSTTNHNSVILDFDIPLTINNNNNNNGSAMNVGEITSSSSTGQPFHVNNTTISISPIISSPISSSNHPTSSNPSNLNNNIETFDENDEELQMVLRLSLLDK